MHRRSDSAESSGTKCPLKSGTEEKKIFKTTDMTAWDLHKIHRALTDRNWTALI